MEAPAWVKGLGGGRRASAPQGPLGYTPAMIIWTGIILLIFMGFAACMWIIYEEYRP